MSRSPSVQLRHIARMAYGDALAAETRSIGTIPVYGSNGPVGEHDRANTLGPVIVIGRKGSYGKVQFSAGPVFAIDTTFYIDRRHTAQNLRWLYYGLQTLGLDEMSEDVGVPGLSRETAYSSRLALPPAQEQRAIADYLDRETARIDALIDLRSKTMDLLQSRVIARATQLTTGTYNGRTKPTGVRWMPNTAEGWPLPSLSQIFRIGSGTTPVSSDETLYDGGIPWLITGDLTDGPVRFTSRTLSPAAIERYPSIRTYRAGSLVVAMYGATTGKLGLLEIDACVNQACCVLTSDRSGSNLERWAFYWMLGHRSGILSLTSGGGQPNISQEEIRSLRIPLPDDSIIDGVLAELDRELASTRRIAQVVEGQITLMRERRQAMITAAVTGQLDIREAA